MTRTCNNVLIETFLRKIKKKLGKIGAHAKQHTHIYYRRAALMVA